ncbi:MAG TPA: ABC transporter permease [Anaeromyxobacter sp.]|nr:ABC transporter permease [Anaeromyxobacter sp.]
MTAILRGLRGASWIWAALGALVMWLLLGFFAGRFNLESLIATSTTAAFLAIVAMGQMIVITTGRGAIDLSIPGVITLSAYLATGMSLGSNARLLWVFPLALAMGAAVGAVNALAVLLLRIPPIIATLGVGYIVTTLILVYNPHYRSTYVASLLTHVARDRLLGVVPLVVLVALGLAALLAWTFRATAFGKSLAALGQSLPAARLSGIDVTLVQIIAYVVSGVLAAFGGVLISARVGGAFLGLGDPYLLETVGSVVVGGTLIMGGRAVPVGTLFGSLFLVLLVTAMQVAGMRIGGQYVAEGALIIAVLLLATGRGAR